MEVFFFHGLLVIFVENYNIEMGRAFEYRKASKMARWDKMAKTFSKIGKDIALAVKAGGPDPESNPALRRCIQNAKGANMPKDNVERAIKKASGADAENYEEVTYEGYGQGGVAFFVECTTNNTTRTVANVRAVFNKFDGNLGKNGELAFIFDRKGIFTIDLAQIKMDWDDFEMEMIDGGAEDVEKDEEEVMITTAFEDFGSLSHKLDELGIEAKSAELQRIPNNTKEVTEDQFKANMKMLERFEEDDDVQNVYHNMEITEDMMSSL
ncbi:YebC/PmpR family DNA-binding regulatory protein [Chryseobacterium sp. SORGH_AS909]|uniref:Probable transcriptional regulatory protein QE404_003804 n=2 Tax=Chryseobacterium group TaxID=2782232 RepID=A0ABU0TNN6_9FLAO|nr:YebC/PmpR family DNA-binding regulatory protein [Chryseobacterium camelliae]MDQ1102582.1 YebC/PmpR family DNA-binding regulatory protein [Chryseobacterium sp. SORGH_AS_1048]MDR6086015.1 YebC/PmpR family DNA-binding regulatory protein [Chryseobacterium sp. SORGH_AS_0909]MDR6130382.1 YebC/PmpR family DNA-binding regulatory protein [Chryseobacterium sp. SORGH_AS_1175]MDT3407490.1 YebC/PmpR family DNA-binding regulatory protein [Pseudacidovorax intermedius]